MPSLKNVKRNLTQINDLPIYLKKMSISQIEKLSTFEGSKDPTGELFKYMFDNFLVDEENNKFDDVETIEQIKDNLDFQIGIEIIKFIGDKFNVNLPKELG